MPAGASGPQKLRQPPLLPCCLARVRRQARPDPITARLGARAGTALFARLAIPRLPRRDPGARPGRAGAWTPVRAAPE